MSDFKLLEADYAPAKVAAAREYLVVISGCSGGGKSSLLRELAARGYRVFTEPGRQIVKEQNFIGGPAIPGKNPRKFAELCISRGIHNMILAASTRAHVFFDRSIVDNINGLQWMPGGAPRHFHRALELFRYAEKVFMTPPWPELFRNDPERTHSLDDAIAEYRTLIPAYQRLGHKVIILPKVSVKERVDFILQKLDEE